MSETHALRDSNRVVRVSLRSLLAVVMLLCAGSHLSAQIPSNAPAVSSAQTPVTFDLSDQFGRRWQSDSLVGRWMVLVLGERAHSARMIQWSDSLSRAFGAESTTVRIFLVADLRAVPRMMHRFASQRAPREAHRRLLLDRDGGVSRQLGLDPKVLTVVVVAPDRRVRMRFVDTPPVAEHLESVRRVLSSR